MVHVLSLWFAPGRESPSIQKILHNESGGHQKRARLASMKGGGGGSIAPLVASLDKGKGSSLLPFWRPFLSIGRVLSG